MKLFKISILLFLLSLVTIPHLSYAKTYAECEQEVYAAAGGRGITRMGMEPRIQTCMRQPSTPAYEVNTYQPTYQAPVQKKPITYQEYAQRYNQEDIITLQTFLNVLVDSNLDITGEYDEDTYLAVKQFQQDEGLHADGLAGQETINTLSMYADEINDVVSENDEEEYEESVNQITRTENKSEENGTSTSNIYVWITRLLLVGIIIYFGKKLTDK